MIRSDYMNEWDAAKLHEEIKRLHIALTAVEVKAARLEEALREIAKSRTFPIKTDEIARRALAHEEEA